MATTTRNISDSLATFDELWSPRTLATVNDTEVRIAKVQGDYVWHRHPDSDEFFVVLDGHLSIGLRDDTDGSERSIGLGPNDTFLVPRGVEHRPSSPGGASIMFLDRTGTLTTGDFDGEVPEHITSTSQGRAID